MENIGNSNKTYRVRTNVGEADNKIDVQLSQHFDILEILSLKIKPSNLYKLQQSNYGVVVGRVVANGGFGVPNAKVSVFIPMKDGASLEEFYQYSYTSTNDMHNGVRYNVLSDEVDRACHQDVGTLPTKTYMLDNNVLMEVFVEYYKLTTSTNASGDYMLFGVPTGNQQIHMDVDLSDIGLLSQTPRDMMYKGYNVNLFDSPTKFKGGADLDSLPQIQSQTKAVYVYPYWGETNELADNIAITRCDIKLAYEFNPTCIFIGAAVTDRASNAIGKKCIATDDCGKMSELTSGEGSIEMIRYNINGNIEECQVMGNRVIDSDGVWCYQIPMNLDYVTTDEFGNTVPTDDPTKGIPTRAKVRFRVALDDTGSESTGRKKARYLIPHNPQTERDVDYNFGSFTKEENFVDLLWNKVYSVKNYIPRIEKSRKASRKRISKTRGHTGIKGVNHSGNNNPIPYNNITMRLNFAYKFRCILLKTLIMFMVAFNTLSWFVNVSLVSMVIRPITTIIKGMSYLIPGTKKFRKKLDDIEMVAQIPYVSLDSEFCMMDEEKPTLYVPIAFETKGIKKRVMEETAYKETVAEYGSCNVKVIKASNFEETELSVCIETQLAEENEVVFYNFYNDWLNGSLYFPLWFRRLRKPRKILFGLIKTKGIDRWCQDEKMYRITQRETCDESEAMKIGGPTSKITSNNGFKRYTTRYANAAYARNSNAGLIHTEKTMLDELVYYYNANWFKTDVILLGSLDDYDRNGIPQFFKYLPSTTYQKPTAVRTTDVDDESKIEASGENWSLDRRDPDYYSTGLFYQLGCLDATTLMLNKTCFNVKRVCELGVDLDQSYTEEDGTVVESDGLITAREIANHDARAMFATMNDYTQDNPRLTVLRNTETSMMEYQLLYSYGKEFDGINWGETVSPNRSYRDFRGGYEAGGSIDVKKRQNSFYFYFGLHEGKTAIEKFNSQYFSDCGLSLVEERCGITVETSEWCEETKENSIKFTFNKNLDYPITIDIEDEGEVETYKLEEKELMGATKTARNYDWTYSTDKYGEYAVTVTDAEDVVVYSGIVKVYPESVRASLSPLPFNVKQDKLAEILANTINDGAKITYANNKVAYGDGAVFSVYDTDENNGCASRTVTIKGYKCELGGSIALTLSEGYSMDDVIITVDGKFEANGVNYTYHKVYDRANQPIVRQLETTNNDGSVTITDVACLYVPYGDVEYTVTVESRCANGMVNDVPNLWSGKVKVGSYTEPVISFNGTDGYSLTLQQVKGLIGIFGANAIWTDIIDNGGILDLPVNEENVYYRRLKDISENTSDSNYALLSSIVDLGDEDAVEENLKNLLYSFYHIFTRTSDEDGFTISCTNRLTDISVENVRYRIFGEETTYAEGVTLSDDAFNVRYGDFSTGEAILCGLDDNFKCVVNDLLHGNSDEVVFHLFDKRMKVVVYVNNCIYKYKDGSDTDVDKVYRGWMSIKIENGFEGYQVVNEMYDQWGYADGYLFPVDTDGVTPIETDLVVRNNFYNVEHRFNLPTSYESDALIIQDGVNNRVSINNALAEGECGLGLGGILAVSPTHASKAEMRDDYSSYGVADGTLEHWRDCELTFGTDSVEVANVSTQDIGHMRSQSYSSENGLAVAGNFIDCRTKSNFSMMASVKYTDEDEIDGHMTSVLHKIVYCDKTSFETKEIAISTTNGDVDVEGVSFALGRDDVDYGYYYTWGVSYAQNGEEWEKCYNVYEASQGFYIDKQHSAGGSYYLAQYDEGEDIDDSYEYDSQGNLVNTYKFHIEGNTDTPSPHRVHWVQRTSAVYRDMWSNLYMNASGRESDAFKYSGYTDKNATPCVYSPKDYLADVEKYFIWLNWGDSPVTGIPRKMDNLGMTDNAFGIIGVLLTTGKVVGRYVIKEVKNI